MGPVAELAAGIDGLQSVEPGSLTDVELARLVLDVDAQQARLTAVHANLVAAHDARRSWEADGSRSCAAWLARRRHASRVRAGAAVRLGRALRSMAATDAALGAGEIGEEHARQLARCQRFSPAAFVDDEVSLVGHARELTWEDFLRVCAAWRDAVDATAAEKQADRLAERRHLVLHRRPDGSLVFQSGMLDPVGAEAFLCELERIERELFDTDLKDARAEHGDDVPLSRLRRTASQRWADALVEMAHRSRIAPADGKRPEPLVSVYVDYETAAGRLCELASGVPITAKQLLPIFTQADIERVVFEPGNRVIELGLRTRFFTGGLRRAIELRDRHCQAPGCTVPAKDCQVDHIIEHSRGGFTVQENGRLYCEGDNLARNRRRGSPWQHGTDPVTGEEADDPEAAAIQAAHIRQRIEELIAERRNAERRSA